MNAISYSLLYVKQVIPLEVLNLAFSINKSVDSIVSLDERITNIVIRPIVLTDLNLIGGIDAYIPLDKCIVKELYYNNGISSPDYIVEVPKTLTNGKSIISAFSISMANPNIGNFVNYANTQYTQPTTTVLSKMMSNITQTSIIQSARLSVIGENIVLIQEPGMYITNLIMKVRLENDNNLNNIPPTSYIKIAELVTLAVKRYIYNHKRISIDQGVLYGGHELGIIKDIIDGYADAATMYNEYLTSVMSIVMVMSNNNTYVNYIKSMFGNNT